MRVALLFFSHNQDLTSLAEACQRFTPMVGFRGQQSIFLDITASQRLFSEESLFLRLQALCKRFACKPSITFANSPAEALIKTFYGHTNEEKLPLEALPLYLNPFQQRADERAAIKEMALKLKQLGTCTITQYRALPLRQLTSRFGKLCTTLDQRLRHPQQVDWPYFTLPERLVEAFDLEENPCDQLQQLLFCIRQLSDRALARLCGRARVLSRFQLTITMDGGQQRRYTFSLGAPQSSVKSVVALIHERLSAELQHQPLQHAMHGLTFEVTESQPSRSRQRNFFHHHEEEEELWQNLIDRLFSRLGEERTFGVDLVERYLPEAAWTKRRGDQLRTTLSRPQPALSAQPTIGQRPLRLLKKPEQLQRIHDWLIMGEHHTQQRWKIVDWQGPERIQGEWWCKDFHRDYYTAETADGQRMWLFVDPSGRCYLHGYFD